MAKVDSAGGKHLCLACIQGCHGKLLVASSPCKHVAACNSRHDAPPNHCCKFGEALHWHCASGSGKFGFPNCSWPISTDGWQLDSGKMAGRPEILDSQSQPLHNVVQNQFSVSIVHILLNTCFQVITWESRYRLNMQVLRHVLHSKTSGEVKH